MATDSASWRYRFSEVDDMVTVIDYVIFLTGVDTFANGNSYHKLSTRSYTQLVALSVNPPVITENANSSDVYYGAMREQDKKVYWLNGTSEVLLYDFNAAIGSLIPTYGTTISVTAIDSVLLGTTYHKRFLTTDSTYYVIEGVGSNRGLLPDLSNGHNLTIFYCYTDISCTFVPDASFPCTYIYPAGHGAGVDRLKPNQTIKMYPVPANNNLNIENFDDQTIQLQITNVIGQVMWQGVVENTILIPTQSWNKGTYLLHSFNDLQNNFARFTVE